MTGPTFCPSSSLKHIFLFTVTTLKLHFNAKDIFTGLEWAALHYCIASLVPKPGNKSILSIEKNFQGCFCSSLKCKRFRPRHSESLDWRLQLLLVELLPKVQISVTVTNQSLTEFISTSTTKISTKDLIDHVSIWTLDLRNMDTFSMDSSYSTLLLKPIEGKFYHMMHMT